MKSKITIPKETEETGIVVETIIDILNSDIFRPVSHTPPDVPSQSSSVIAQAPLGPDGKPLILQPDGVTYKPATLFAPFTEEQINSLTNNGTNTDLIFNVGLEELINRENGLLPDSNKFPESVGGGPLAANGAAGTVSNSSSIPGVFTGNTKLIGQQLWQYKAVLFNHKLKEYEIPTRSIKIICIEDDLLSWPLRGYIVVDSRMEGFERANDIGSAYFLRSDARDELFLDVKPIIEKGNLPDEIWRIQNTFVIYDVEDLPHPDLTIKAKKLYFWDKRFQFLLEKNIQWSTATGKRKISQPCPAPVAHATDEERAMYTGEAIWSLLYEAGYEQYIDITQWDWGKGKINFVAKADWSIWDCIQYILEQQISNDGKNDICALQWNRGKGKWTLSSAAKVFEKAGKATPGPLQVEHMFFEENVTEKKDMSPPKAPLSTSISNTIDIKADDFNKIRNYRFSQISGLDNSKAFVSRPVYSHWHRKKQFDVDVMENEIKNVKDNFFKNNYVKKLLSQTDFAQMPLNKTKTDQKVVDPQFSPISTLQEYNDRYIRSLSGRGKILYAGIFLNQNLVVRMSGSTHRLTGTFIGVDRITTPSETIYDYQVCGQYLVTNVKHIIQQQKFINEITMVKVHAYKSLPINENIE